MFWSTRRPIVNFLFVLPWIAVGSMFLSCSPSSGETLDNGIEMPSPWPPNVRTIGSEPTATPYYLKTPPSVIPINVGRQLFVDDFLIENTTMTRKFHSPVWHPKSPVLTPDKPWEAAGSNPPTAMPFSGGVWYDPQDKLFKMWYIAGFNQAMCYATSTDGIDWTKPTLDVVPGTNIVYKGWHDSTMVWLDRETSDPSQRFKMMLNIPTGEHEIRYSADGIHWGAAVATTGATFDRSTFFYNPFRKMWVLSLKGVVYDPTAGESVSGTYAGGSARPETSGKGTVGLSRMRRYAEKPTLTDAARSWAEGTAESAEWYQNSCLPTMWVGADRLDPPRADIGTNPELYNLDCVAYESVMVGLFTIWRGVPKNYPNRDKINNVCVGFSRDGFHWDRSNRTPILDVSEDPNAWNCSNVQSAGGCLLTVGDQLYIYASGRQARQSGVCSTGLATMRRDGFASMEAGQQEGTLTTRLVEFSDKHLFVNVAINGGQLQAEVLDENGTVIGPFSRESCVPITSDSTLAQVSWNGAADLSSVAGKHVKFRFHVRNGSLYSFWVSPDPNGASYGYIGAGGPGFSTTRDLPVSAPR